MSFDNLAKVADALGVTMSTLLDGLENGSAANLKVPRAEAGGQGAKDAIHRTLEAQKLMKRLKLQHAEMNRTILALEDLPGRNRRRSKSPSRRAPK